MYQTKPFSNTSRLSVVRRGAEQSLLVDNASERGKYLIFKALAQIIESFPSILDVVRFGPSFATTSNELWSKS